jgi:hypothetical protein
MHLYVLNAISPSKRGRLIAGSCGLAMSLAACSGGGSEQSKLSTASILGEAPAAASADKPGITKDDPMARPVQVAWTSARAQKCGFNFDAGKLKTNYIAFEQRGGADANRLGSIDKTYDMTVGKIKGSIGDSDTYCTDKQSAAIKADLTRHLSGNFEPNFPEEKKVADGGFFSKTADQTNHGTFSQGSFWRDYEDKKNGAKKSD